MPGPGHEKPHGFHFLVCLSLHQGKHLWSLEHHSAWPREKGHVEGPAMPEGPQPRHRYENEEAFEVTSPQGPSDHNFMKHCKPEIPS